MKLTQQQRAQLTPLAKWILDYVREHDTTLTELSREAGLSLGALRSLIIYPERTPNLETCLQLAQVTKHPSDQIIRLAGVKKPIDLADLDVDRITLLRAYDNLTNHKLRRALADFGQALVQSQMAG